MKRKLLRLWYIITSPSQDRLLFVHRSEGKFRVLYKDGQKSQPFGYPTAKDYAKMFGGEVIDNF